MKEQAQIAFTTILGSGAKARAFLGELQQFAAKTPFEFPDLTRASQKLLAMGFEAKQIIPIMTDVGNAVAGVGGSAADIEGVVTVLGQIQAKGRLMAEEMNQLAERNVFSWRALADALGISVSQAMDAVKRGAIDADMFLAAFQANAQKRFGGMMEEQAKTFNGLLSTLKDTFAQVSATVMEPFFERARNGMARLVEFTSSPAFTAGIQRFADFIDQRVVPAIDRLISTVIQQWPTIQAVFLGLAGAVQTIGPMVLDVVGHLVRLAESTVGVKTAVVALAGAWLVWQTGAITAAVKVTAAHVAAAATTGAAWRAALIATGWGALAVAAGLAAAYIITHWEQVKRFFSDTLPRAIQAVPAALKAAAGQIPTILAGALKLAAANALVVLATLAKGAEKALGWIPGIGGKIKDASRAIQDFVGDLARDGMADFARAGKAVGGAWGDAFYGTVTDAARRAQRDVEAAMSAAIVGAASEKFQGGTIVRRPGIDLPGGTFVDPGRTPAGRVNPASAIGGTQPTSGLPGFSGADLMAKRGTLVVAPEDGQITRLSGRTPDNSIDPKGGPWGLTLYYVGKSGNVYYLTHMEAIAGVGAYKRGDVIGIVGTYGTSGAPHLHVGVAGGPAALAKAREGSSQTANLGTGAAGAGGATTDLTGIGETLAAATVEEPDKPKPATRREIADVQREIANIAASVPEALASVRVKLDAEMDALVARLKKRGLTKEALGAIEDDFKLLAQRIAQAVELGGLDTAVKRAQGQIAGLVSDGLIPRNVAAAFKRQGAEIRAAIDAAGEEIKKGNLVPDAVMERLKAQAENFRERVAALVDAAEIRAEIGRSFKTIKDAFAQGLIDSIDVGHLQQATARAKKAYQAYIRALADPTADPETVARLKENFERLAGVVTQAGDSLAGEIQANADNLKRVGLRFKEAIRDGILTDAEVSTLSSAIGNLKGKIGEQLGGLVTAIEDARGKFQAAWDRFLDYALRQFDRAAAELRRTIVVDVTVEGRATFQFSEGGETPAEAELRKLREEREERARREEQARLEERVRIARETGEGLAEAEKALSEFLLDERERSLDKLARVEREAAEQRLSDAQDAYDVETAERRSAFADELNDIRTRMANGAISYDQGLAEIKAVFAKYNVPFADAGSELGNALSAAMVGALEGLKTAMKGIESAIRALASEIRKLAGEALVDAGKAEGAAARARAAASSAAQAANPNVPNPLNPAQTGNIQSPAAGPLPNYPAPPAGTTGGGGVTAPPGTPLDPNRAGGVLYPTFWSGGLVGRYVGAGALGLRIPGEYTPIDSLIARVSPGELISTPRQAQRALWALMNGAQFGGGTLGQTIFNLYASGHVLTERDFERYATRIIARAETRSGRRPLRSARASLTI